MRYKRILINCVKSIMHNGKWSGPEQRAEADQATAGRDSVRPGRLLACSTVGCASSIAGYYRRSPGHVLATDPPFSRWCITLGAASRIFDLRPRIRTYAHGYAQSVSTWRALIKLSRCQRTMPRVQCAVNRLINEKHPLSTNLVMKNTQYTWVNKNASREIRNL